jgi:hypothetical protein
MVRRLLADRTGAMGFILPADIPLCLSGRFKSLTLASSRPLLARWRFFSRGWWRCRWGPTALGAFLSWGWLLPWWDIFCTWSARWCHLLLLKHSFYAGFRFRSDGGCFFSGSSSKQQNGERNYYECKHNTNPQPHSFAAVSSSCALGAFGSSESSSYIPPTASGSFGSSE